MPVDTNTPVGSNTNALNRESQTALATDREQLSRVDSAADAPTVNRPMADAMRDDSSEPPLVEDRLIDHNGRRTTNNTGRDLESGGRRDMLDVLAPSQRR